LGTNVWAEPPFRVTVDPVGLVTVPRVRFPPTFTVAPEFRFTVPPAAFKAPVTVVVPVVADQVPPTTADPNPSVPVPPFKVPATVTRPPALIPRFVSVNVVALFTVNVPARSSWLPVTVTTGVAPVINARFPIWTPVVTFPVPLMLIVEFAGVPKVPDTDTLPPALMVFAAVFVTVPLLVKLRQVTVPEVPRVPDPPTFTTAVPDPTVTPPGTVSVPPVTDRVPVTDTEIAVIVPPPTVRFV
jgi:hypothetical protein